MKIVFVDAEFTGEHAYTTLVSLGLVTLEGRELYLTLNDFDRQQVTEWLTQNVLSMIDSTRTITSRQAWQQLSAFLEQYSGGERVHLCSAGKMTDLPLLFELYKQANPDLKYFHALHCLPEYLNHGQHFDLNTLLYVVGADMNAPREHFLGREVSPKRHDALYDAKVVRDCFLKMLEEPALKRFAAAIV